MIMEKINRIIFVVVTLLIIITVPLYFKPTWFDGYASKATFFNPTGHNIDVEMNILALGKLTYPGPLFFYYLYALITILVIYTIYVVTNLHKVKKSIKNNLFIKKFITINFTIILFWIFLLVLIFTGLLDNYFDKARLIAFYLLVIPATLLSILIGVFVNHKLHKKIPN